MLLYWRLIFNAPAWHDIPILWHVHRLYSQDSSIIIYQALSAPYGSLNV